MGTVSISFTIFLSAHLPKGKLASYALLMLPLYNAVYNRS